MGELNQVALQKGMEDFFHMSLDLMCISDLKGNLLKVNNAWEKVIGYTIEEMEGKLFADFIHPDDVESTFSTLSKLDNGEEIINFTNRYLTKGGVYKTIEWRARPKGNMVFATANDVTEREKKVNGLTMQKELLEETASVSGVGGWEVDLVNNKLIWSDTTKKIHEVSDDFVPSLDVGINFYKEGESRETITKVVENGMKTGEGWDVELQLITAKNREIWVRAIGKAVLKDGVCTRLYGTFQDITEKRKYQETLEDALQLAREAAKAKSSFLSNMSHEIRTPLNAVVGMSHLLLQNNPRPDQLEKLETLHFSANNLMILVNDILDYSKIEEGKITFEKIPFSLIETVKNIKHTFKFKAEEKGIKFKVQVDPDMPNYVEGDPTRLIQILNNLISNAIKFTEKGKVVLSIELVKTTANDTTILFEVCDSGIGMSGEQVKKVFDRFEQANVGTTRKFGGTGLGLSIVKKLLEFQGSKIDIDSTEGKGSVFSFELKLNRSKVEGIARNGIAQVNREVKDLKGMRILLVEDNPMNQLVATEFLKNWNVELDYAINGAEAVEKVTDHHYDVVLMDIQMPVMDGYQATMQIKKMNNGKENIPIIAMTASTMLDVRHRIAEIGMIDHILKPFNPTELNVKLSHYMPIDSGKGIDTKVKNGVQKDAKIEVLCSINFNNLDKLSDGNKAFAKKILNTFLIDLDNLKRDYAEAVKERNPDNINFMVHRNKSMIRMLALTELESIIKEHEQLITNKDWERIDLGAFQNIINCILQKITEHNAVKVEV